MNSVHAGRARSRQIRQLVNDIRECMENLGVGVGIARAEASRGSNGVAVLRTSRGKLLG